jgi:succinate-semialdehyde dehydrogenase/glutarate-semialdehyde dehydrogenase
MSLVSKNPFSEEILHTFEEISPTIAKEKLDLAKNTFDVWKKTGFKERSQLLHKFALILRQKRDIFTALIASEMGMPVSQASGEIEKSAQISEYYADNTEAFLANKSVNTGAKESYVSYEPLGVLLHIAPWNYPYYLALRPIIPAIMAGNTVLLKHASNVPQIGASIEAIFTEAGFPKGVVQNLAISSKSLEPVIRDKKVSMVTLIGSEWAGSQVAKTAGEELKKTVMELGGSDPFIALKDANIKEAAKQATASRLRNQGQSCNAAKRFIIMEEVAEEFTNEVKGLFAKEIFGDPLNPETTTGPLATQSSLEDIKRQVEESVKMGAKVLIGGHGESEKATENWQNFRKNYKKGYFYPPTILTNITKEMPIYKEEVFGPAVPIIIVQSIEEAVQVANDSSLGLGASLWTQDLDLAKKLIPQLDCGMVCVNSMVRSNIKMPYGGVKRSGYGRELGKHGLMEFVNVKSVVIS